MGAALLAPLARTGARVVSLDGNESADRTAAAAAATAGFVPCDVSDRASVNAAFAAATGMLDGLDTLVHAAGIAPAAPAEHIAPEAWDRVFAVNARGTMLANQAAFSAAAGRRWPDPQFRFGRGRQRPAQQGALSGKQGRRDRLVAYGGEVMGPP